MKITQAMFLLASFTAFSVRAQDSFEYTYSTPTQSYGNAISTAPDGGYYLAGGYNQVSPSTQRAFIIRTDSQGDIQWTRMYSNIGLSIPGIQAVSSGGCIFVCPSTDFFYNVIRLDANGNTLWQGKYETPTSGGLPSVIECHDGGFLISGSFAFSIQTIKIDSMGAFQWSWRYKGLGGSSGYVFDSRFHATETSDHGFIIAGNSLHFQISDSNAMLAKIDSVGTLEWTTFIGGDFDDIFRCALEDDDGNFYALGYSATSDFTGSSDVLFAKFSATGDLIWNKTYDSGDDENGYCFAQLSSGNFVIVGDRGDTFTPYFNGILLQVDSDGNLIYAEKMNFQSVFRELDFASDGRIVLTGTLQNEGSPAESVSLIKLTNESKLPCNAKEYPFTTADPSLVQASANEAFTGGSVSSITVNNEIVNLSKEIICSFHADIQPQEKENYLLYPNPVKDHFYLSFPNEMNEQLDFYLFSALGDLVCQRDKLSALDNRVDLDDIAPGIYHFCLMSANREVLFTGKVIIQQ